MKNVSDGYPYISVIVPVYNEEGSLRELTSRLLATLQPYSSYEIIFVNDGSNDGSFEILESLFSENEYILVISLVRRQGKSSALQAGFDTARGELVIMIDADLQDHPEEIPKLVEKLEQEDLDIVTGWKLVRNDPLSKTIPSRLFNMATSKLSGLKVHDLNCGLKVMRAKCLKDLFLYGQLHRFMLVMLSSSGYRVGEVPVKHSMRKHGQSKYGSRRLIEGVLDFFTIFFICRFLHSPMYFFGTYGLLFFLFSVVIGLYFFTGHAFYLFSGSSMWALDKHPLWLFSPFLLFMSLICFFIGSLAQLILHINNMNLHRMTVAHKTVSVDLTAKNPKRGKRRA